MRILNKISLVWFWRNTVVPEAKGIFWMVVIVAAFACLTSHAEEVKPAEWEVGDELTDLPSHWELTIVDDNDLIDTPVHFMNKRTCIEVGIAYVHADDSLNGFVCEEKKGE